MHQQLNYRLTLYALLHDIGKPILRFSKRYLEGIERGDVAGDARRKLEELLSISIEELSRMDHVAISHKVISKLLKTALSPDEERLVEKVIDRVDRFAASERGLEIEKELYERVQSLWPKIEEEISKKIGKGFRYSHYVVPMLSPSWILIETGYLNHVGVKAFIEGVAGKWDMEKAEKKFLKLFAVYRHTIDGQEKEFVDSIVNAITSLAPEDLWLPVKPLNPQNIMGLKASSLIDAARLSSYAEVVNQFIDLLETTITVYNGSVSRGLINTVLNTLKSSALFIPSAIYWSLVPDISLYSHSKLVAAYTASQQLSSKVRWLVVDANRIQGFIASPVSAAAASRVIRGRSLLVELSLDSLVNYVLELFGGLTQANVLISEGGTLDIVVPDLSDMGARLEKLKSVAKELSMFLGGLLGFTAVITDPFDIESSRFHETIAQVGEERSGLARVLEDLKLKVAFEKSRKGIDVEDVKTGGIVAREDDVLGFDAITMEPVIRGDPYALKVDIGNKNYVDRIAGFDKLAFGEIIGTATHLSLVAGTAARKLLCLISVHIYRRDSEGIPIPASDTIARFTSRLCKVIDGNSRNLYFTSSLANVSTDVGVIPLEPSGSVYLVISMPKEAEPVAGMKYVDATIDFIAEVLKRIESVLVEQMEEGLVMRMSVEFVNMLHNFIPSRKSFIESLRELIDKGVDVSLGFKFLGPYHPMWLVKKDDREDLMLVDLDPYGIIAVAKMDIDMFGKVRELLARSPSRLVTLSDIVNTVVAGKAYLYAVSKQNDLAMLKPSKIVDVVPLYAGGDDVAVYGKWAQVLRYVIDVYKEIRGVLNPLTISVGIAMGRSTEPLLMLYSRAVEMLEKSKKVKASAVIDIEFGHTNIFKCNGDRYKPVNVIPMEQQSKYYPMPQDIVDMWSLDKLAKLLDVFPEDGKKILENLEKFEEFKRDLHMLSAIGSEFSKIVRYEHDDCKSLKELIKHIDKGLALEILYSYTWARKKQNLNKLKEILKAYGLEILEYPDDIANKTNVLEALRILLASKPIIDLVLLALRRRDTVDPSNFEQTK